MSVVSRPRRVTTASGHEVNRHLPDASGLALLAALSAKG
jgi:hypothetical protein